MPESCYALMTDAGSGRHTPVMKEQAKGFGTAAIVMTTLVVWRPSMLGLDSFLAIPLATVARIVRADSSRRLP
jgi:hypothetical protein